MNLTSSSSFGKLSNVGSSAIRVPVRARAIDTRRRLVAAAEREYAEHGYEATTARSITERAGTALGSFYTYFPDKDALLRELTHTRQNILLQQLQELYVGIAVRSPPPASELERRLSGMVRVVVDYHRENPELHAVISERRHSDPELGEIIAAGERSLVQALVGLLDRDKIHRDPLATAFVLFGLVEGAVHAHVLGEPAVSDARFLAALVEATKRVAFPSGVPATRTTRTSRTTKKGKTR
jgi:AcrR family transcriptional regulator